MISQSPCGAGADADVPAYTVVVYIWAWIHVLNNKSVAAALQWSLSGHCVSKYWASYIHSAHEYVCVSTPNTYKSESVPSQAVQDLHGCIFSVV